MGEPSYQVQPQVPGALTGLTNQASALAGHTPTPVRPFQPNPGGARFAAPMTGGESQALGRLRGLTYGSNPIYNAGSQTLSDTLGGRYLNPATNPYLSSTGDAFIRKSKEGFGALNDQLNGNLNATGNLHSTAGMGVRTNALERSNQSLSEQLSALYGGNYSNERSNMLSALAPGLNYSQAPFSQTADLLGYEGLPRSIEDKNTAGQYSDFTRMNTDQEHQNELPFNQIMSLLGGYPLAYPQYTPGRSSFQDVGDVAGGGANMAIMMKLLMAGA